MGCCGLVNKCFMMICNIVLIMLAIGGTTPCSSAFFSLEEGSKYEHPLSKWKVGISNEMIGPNQTLKIHCKSKNDDLGEHNLNVGQRVLNGNLRRIWYQPLCIGTPSTLILWIIRLLFKCFGEKRENDLLQDAISGIAIGLFEL